MESTLPDVLIGTALFALAVYLTKRVLVARSRPLPPGPPGLPLVGNLFNWPTTKAYKTFFRWAEQYGDVVHANVGGVDMILINNVETATAMLNGKGSIYSDRPPSHFLGHLVGWEESLIMLNDGPQLREQRRLFIQALGTKTLIEPYIGMTETRSRNFLKKLMEDPAQRIDHFVRMLAGGSILDVTYGYEAHDSGDPYVDTAVRAMNDWSKAARPGAYLVDTLPWLSQLPSWFPGTGFKKEALEMRQTWLNLLHKPFQFTKEQLIAGTAKPSVVASHIEGGKLSASGEASLRLMASNMYAGGSDTMVSVICSFFLFMTLYPEVQAKAQAEIDLVVGSSRLPEVEDQERLPYVTALINEVYRCGSVNPQGIAHRLRVDDVHDGYFIPKNSLILPNIWYMARDPRNYKNPEVFNPDRFLGERPELDPRAYVFGFGRRICPGRLFSDNIVFLAISNSLATLNIMKTKNASGQDITPIVDYRDGIIAHPCEFPCQLQFRSEQAKALIRSDRDH